MEYEVYQVPFDHELRASSQRITPTMQDDRLKSINLLQINSSSILKKTVRIEQTA